MILFVVFSVFLAGVQSQGGPGADDVEYVLVFESPIYVCPDEASKKYIDVSKIETVRHNESTAYVTGSVNFHQSFDHDTMIIIQMEKESSGRYEVMMTHEICDVCAEMGNPDSPYDKYLQYFGFPEKCPFEPGEYPIHDLIVDTSDLPINSANTGKYQATVSIYSDPDGNCKDNLIFKACTKFDLLIEASFK